MRRNDLSLHIKTVAAEVVSAMRGDRCVIDRLISDWVRSNDYSQVMKGFFCMKGRMVSSSQSAYMPVHFIIVSSPLG